MVQCVGVLVLAVAGLLGAAWAAEPEVEATEGQVSGVPSAEAVATDVAPEPMQSGQRDEGEGLLSEACRHKTCSFASSTLFNLPGCFAKLLDPCIHGGGAVSLAVFAVFFAVLMRQTAIGYRQNWPLSFALFLILFLGATILNIFVLPEATMFNLFEASKLDEFVTIFFASAFFAGVLAFWTRYLLDLLAVVAAASFVALLASTDLLESVQMTLIVATGIAGGIWLYWWRDLRQKRKAPGGGHAPIAGGGNPGYG